MRKIINNKPFLVSTISTQIMMINFWADAAFWNTKKRETFSYRNKSRYLQMINIRKSSVNFYKSKRNSALKISSKSNVQSFFILDIIEKESDGFFSQTKKIIVIVDYPLTNMQKELKSRLVNQL